MEKIMVTRSSMPRLEEYVEEIKDIWNTRWLTNMGEKHRKLQKQLLEYMQVESVELLTNGHMALELTLQAMDLQGEVITTPFTFASTTHAIVRNGLTPIFCDINPLDFTIDTLKIEQLITDKTSAIVPVHVYGNVCAVEEIEKIAIKYGLKVIYDAAHTFGVTYRGKGIGTFGDASCFSFHATKVFNTIEGGAVCYKSKELGKKIYNLKNFGIRDEETIESIGANAKMNEFQAAMGICNLQHIREEIQKRKIITEYYRERLKDIKGIQLNPVQEETESNYAYFPVLFDEEEFGANRNKIYEKLKENNIYARKYFYPLTSQFECYNRNFDVQDTPVALEVANKVLTLPLYADLSIEDVDRICGIILEEYSRNN